MNNLSYYSSVSSAEGPLDLRDYGEVPASACSPGVGEKRRCLFVLRMTDLLCIGMVGMTLAAAGVMRSIL